MQLREKSKNSSLLHQRLTWGGDALVFSTTVITRHNEANHWVTLTSQESDGNKASPLKMQQKKTNRWTIPYKIMKCLSCICKSNPTRNWCSGCLSSNSLRMKRYLFPVLFVAKTMQTAFCWLPSVSSLLCFCHCFMWVCVILPLHVALALCSLNLTSGGHKPQLLHYCALLSV